MFLLFGFALAVIFLPPAQAYVQISSVAESVAGSPFPPGVLSSAIADAQFPRHTPRLTRRL